MLRRGYGGSGLGRLVGRLLGSLVGLIIRLFPFPDCLFLYTCLCGHGCKHAYMHSFVVSISHCIASFGREFASRLLSFWLYHLSWDARQGLIHHHLIIIPCLLSIKLVALREHMVVYRIWLTRIPWRKREESELCGSKTGIKIEINLPDT